MSAGLVVTVVGAGAALCSTVSFVPQLAKLWREKTGEAVSLPMYVLTVTAFSLWSAYGFMLSSWPLVVSNLVSLALSSAILVLKWRYLRRSGSQAGEARASAR
ncbi:MAG TPA: SemiSWEET transporter [Caulobacteraceae bacterium]|jgi:MtN3 and saliva related transmembrane protein